MKNSDQALASPRTLALSTDNVGADTDELFTKHNLTDYELVIADPSGAIKGRTYNYSIRLTRPHRLTMGASEGHQYLERVRKISQQIGEFVASGGFCIMLLRQMPTIDVSGRSSDLNEMLPYGSIRCTEAHGENIEWSTDPSFAAFGAMTQGLWRYDAYFKSDKLKVVATVKGHPSQALAADIATEGNGRLVLLPTPRIKGPEELGRLFDGYRSLFNTLRTSTPAATLPSWNEQFLLPSEAEARQSIEKTIENLQTLSGALERQRSELAAIERLKILTSGTDSALERAVDDALTELGLAVQEPHKKKRVDRVATWNGKTLAIEVQGVKKGAAEDHARSLIVWVQEIAMATGVEPKGLLVVNTFRNELPSKCTANSWPGQTIELCKRNGFCAITGMQLLGLLFEARQYPDRKASLVEKLFNTVGALEGYSNWSDLFTEQTTSATK